jgi:hypothetical protein
MLPQLQNEPLGSERQIMIWKMIQEREACLEVNESLLDSAKLLKYPCSSLEALSAIVYCVPWLSCPKTWQNVQKLLLCIALKL